MTTVQLYQPPGIVPPWWPHPDTPRIMHEPSSSTTGLVGTVELVAPTVAAGNGQPATPDCSPRAGNPTAGIPSTPLGGCSTTFQPGGS